MTVPGLAVTEEALELPELLDAALGSGDAGAAAEGEALRVSFSLPPGSYATTVVSAFTGAAGG